MRVGRLQERGTLPDTELRPGTHSGCSLPQTTPAVCTSYPPAGEIPSVIAVPGTPLLVRSGVATLPGRRFFPASSEQCDRGPPWPVGQDAQAPHCRGAGLASTLCSPHFSSAAKLKDSAPQNGPDSGRSPPRRSMAEAVPANWRALQLTSGRHHSPEVRAPGNIRVHPRPVVLGPEGGQSP